MLLSVQIAGGILLAAFTLVLLWLAYKGVRWLKLKYDCWRAEEAYTDMLAAEIIAERRKAEESVTRRGNS